MRVERVLSILVVAQIGSALLTCGCVPKNSFGPNAFTHQSRPYSVRYRGVTVSDFVSTDWLLDNYQWKNGKPNAEKHGSDYVIRRGYDTDDDGEVDVRNEEQFFDLRFTHKKKDAEIWLQSVPISSRDADKELAVLADRYVDAASGAGEVLVRYGEDGPVGSVSKRFATKVLNRAACMVSGRPAFQLDFEIANVDQLQLSPNARWSRGRIVLIDVPFDYKVEGTHGKTPYTAAMLAGLSTAPEDFGTLAPDFEAFLDRVVIAEKQDALASQAPMASTCRTQESAIPAAATNAPAPVPAAATPTAGPPSAEPITQ